MRLDTPNKSAAQKRADQIAAFRAEVAQLSRDGAMPVAPGELKAISAHHDKILISLAREFDVDRSSGERQMSLGMRLASVFGAGALIAAVVSFAYRVWGSMPTEGQVALVTLAPIVSLGIMLLAGRLEKTRYVASLFGIVACGAFVLQTVILGQLFNRHASPHTLAAWGAFALIVAAPWRFGVPFAFGVIALVGYVPAVMLWSQGYWWTTFLQRPELFGFTAALALSLVVRAPQELAAWGRAVLLVIVLGTLLVLSSEGSVSLLPFEIETIQIVYQAVSLVAVVTLITMGLRRRLGDLITLGAIFGGAFLLIRFVDWWWDWMPKYLFFLIIGIGALSSLWGLRLARARLSRGWA